MHSEDKFPSLPLDKWEETCNTLHLYLQIIGKIRMALFPQKNHWWHATLYVSSRGISTGPIPHERGSFTIELDFIDHALNIAANTGQSISTKLHNLSVAEFYHEVLVHLSELGIKVKIKTLPYDIPDVSVQPFEKNSQNASYDEDYVRKFWAILVQVDSIFQEYRGGFLGKATPIHLFWHHMDLALTLFSGKRAPQREGAGLVEREAYSHELISFGFWAGDKNVREPAFYGYAYPPPEGYMNEKLKPAQANWNRDAGLAILMYSAIRETDSPRDMVLEFLESVYRAGAMKLGWDIDELRYTPLERLKV